MTSNARQLVDEQERRWAAAADETRARDESFIEARRAWIESAQRLQSKESAVASAVQRLELERIDTTTSLLRLGVDCERELLKSRLAALQKVDDAISTIAPHSDLRLMLHGRAVAGALRVIAADGTPGGASGAQSAEDAAACAAAAEADLVAASGGTVTKSSRTFAKRRAPGRSLCFGRGALGEGGGETSDDDDATDVVVNGTVKLSTLSPAERRRRRNAKQEAQVDGIMSSVFPQVSPVVSLEGSPAGSGDDEGRGSAAAAPASMLPSPSAAMLAPPPSEESVFALFESATGRRLFIRRLNLQRAQARTLSGTGFLRLKQLMDGFLDACVRNTDIKAASMAMIMSQTFYKRKTARDATPKKTEAGSDASKRKRRSRRHSLHEYMQVCCRCLDANPRLHPFSSLSLSLSLLYSPTHARALSWSCACAERDLRASDLERSCLLGRSLSALRSRGVAYPPRAICRARKRLAARQWGRHAPRQRDAADRHSTSAPPQRWPLGLDQRQRARSTPIRREARALSVRANRAPRLHQLYAVHSSASHTRPHLSLFKRSAKKAKEIEHLYRQIVFGQLGSCVLNMVNFGMSEVQTRSIAMRMALAFDISDGEVGILMSQLESLVAARDEAATVF